MLKIQRSALFKRQLIHFVKGYKERAGAGVASNFIDGVDVSVKFIGNNPSSCLVYTEIDGYEFRKWKVKNFPHSIFFRLQDDVIILEALYAHKMDIESRIPFDLDH